MTIVRIWRGVTLASKAGQYLDYLNKIVAPACHCAEGNESLVIMREHQGELVHFLLLSFWTSEEAWVNFAGGDSSEVVNPPPEEKSLLIAFESTARLYEVVYTSKSPPIGK